LSVRNPKTYFFLLALLSAVLLFNSLHRGGLAGYDDAFFAHQGKEMVVSGDWWNVHFNGHLAFEYPPLYFWLEAMSFRVFGVNDFAAKFPTALCGLATILLVYFLTYELTGQIWLALLAMLVLMSTQFFVKNATHAMTDVPFTFFFTLTIFLYIKGLQKPAYLVFLGLPLGLALLTRSVVGLLAVGIIVAHLILTKRYEFLRSPWLAAGFLLAIALPAAWYGSQFHSHGAEVIQAHLRFVNSKIHVESASSNWTTVFNYPMALLKYYWPWLPFLLVGLALEARAMRETKDSVATLLIVWVLFIFVPFSFAQTRYPRYIMAVFPAFSILSAMALDRLIPVGQRELFLKSACAIAGLAVVLVPLFPAKARAADIRTLAPIADANCLPGQRVLFYTYENDRWDYQWQFLWYGHHYTDLASDVNDLASRVEAKEVTTVIVDKQSYEKLRNQVPSNVAQNWKILGESENLLCFRSE
jgi:4-amino-4-deoxy-L-arabinose transferase-like glycosyltransferase